MDREIVILASLSPRRRDLLRGAGIPFEVCPTDVDETTDLPAAEAVAELARRKALASAQAHPGRTVLAADTLVALDGVSLGKPANAREASRMLHALSGRAHEVVTGVCARRDGREVWGTRTTRVVFRSLSDEEIERYVASGEPMDKAGAYAIQGGAAAFVERYDGEYDNVIGLPVELARELLRQLQGD